MNDRAKSYVAYFELSPQGLSFPRQCRVRPLSTSCAMDPAQGIVSLPL